MPNGLNGLSMLVKNGLEAEAYAPLTTQVGEIRGTLFTLSGSPVFSLLAVDGTTPKTLTAGPSGETWYDVELRVLHSGSGDFGSQKFGGCSAGLSSGLDVKTAGVSLAYPLVNNGVADLWGAHRKNVDFATWIIPLAGILTSGQAVTIGVSEDLTALSGGTNALPVLVYRAHV